MACWLAAYGWRLRSCRGSIDTPLRHLARRKMGGKSMTIGNGAQPKSRRAQKTGAAAVTRLAIAKAVAQLDLASNAARLCDPELSQDLADILRRLAALQ